MDYIKEIIMSCFIAISILGFSYSWFCNNKIKEFKKTEELLNNDFEYIKKMDNEFKKRWSK